MGSDLCGVDRSRDVVWHPFLISRPCNVRNSTHVRASVHTRKARPPDLFRNRNAPQSETVKAQQAIEAARLVELQRIADDSERPMTALEKTRLMHLQNMEDKQKAEVCMRSLLIPCSVFEHAGRLKETAMRSHLPSSFHPLISPGLCRHLLPRSSTRRFHSSWTRRPRHQTTTGCSWRTSSRG